MPTIDRRTHCQRAGRGLRSADVAGAARACLSRPQGARACHGHLGKLQRPCLHHRADARRLAGRQHRLAQHLLRDPADLRGGAGADVLRACGKAPIRKAASSICPAKGWPSSASSAFAFAAIEGSHWGWTSPLILTIAAVAVVALCSCSSGSKRARPGPLLPLAFLRLPVFSAALACRRSHDLRHVRPAVHHAALFPDHARRQLRSWPGLNCCRCR